MLYLFTIKLLIIIVLLHNKVVTRQNAKKVRVIYPNL
jgi:hypothetical protein